MKLIDKAAVVAEIKRLIKANELYLSESATNEVRFQKTGAYSVCNDLLHFLDTLELKEVDLNKEEERIWKDFNIAECHLSRRDLECIAKHFFELGFNTEKLS